MVQSDERWTKVTRLTEWKEWTCCGLYSRRERRMNDEMETEIKEVLDIIIIIVAVIKRNKKKAIGKSDKAETGMGKTCQL